MTRGRILAIVGLGGLAAYLLVIRRNPQTGATGLDELAGGVSSVFGPSAANAATLLPGKGAGNTSADGPTTPSSIATQAIGLIGAGSTAVAAWLAAGGSTAAAGAAGATAATGGASAGSTAGATAGAGLGTAATIGITAGIGGGIILAWAIWKKGLFRGGDEALHVNPARDQFLAQFAKWDYMRDSRNPPGFYGLALLLSILTPNDSQGLFAALTRADTMPKFNGAVAAIVNRIKTATADEDRQITDRLAFYNLGGHDAGQLAAGY